MEAPAPVAFVGVEPTAPAFLWRTAPRREQSTVPIGDFLDHLVIVDGLCTMRQEVASTAMLSNVTSVGSTCGSPKWYR